MRVPLVQQASWEQLGESSKPIHTCDCEDTAFSALPTRFVGCVSCLCLPVVWSDPTHLTAVGLSQVEKVPTRKASSSDGNLPCWVVFAVAAGPFRPNRTESVPSMSR